MTIPNNLKRLLPKSDIDGLSREELNLVRMELRDFIEGQQRMEEFRQLLDEKMEEELTAIQTELIELNEMLTKEQIKHDELLDKCLSSKAWSEDAASFEQSKLLKELEFYKTSSED